MLENLDKVLAELASKLNVATPFIWSALEKQVKVVTAYSILGIVLCIIALVIGILCLAKASRDNDENIGFAGIMITIISLLILLTCVLKLIQLTINPDYWILNTILSNFK